MMFQVQIINGEKVLVPLSGGTGLPLATIIPIYSNIVPAGYLPCNGVEFDENQYPALYQHLGDNHTPDLRECVLVGIGESGRSGIATHDVYTLGQFKDDQLQDHVHRLKGGNANTGSQELVTPGTISINALNSFAINQAVTSVSEARVGTTTHGKQVGINLVIKATTGLDETQQDYVLQSLNEYNRYSTDEYFTGKYWIDGKKIYGKVLFCTATTSIPNQSWSNVKNIFAGMSDIAGSIDTIVDAELFLSKVYKWGLCLFLKDYPSANDFSIFSPIDTSVSAGSTYIVLQYTKTS